MGDPIKSMQLSPPDLRVADVLNFMKNFFAIQRGEDGLLKQDRGVSSSAKNRICSPIPNRRCWYLVKIQFKIMSFLSKFRFLQQIFECYVLPFFTRFL